MNIAKSLTDMRKSQYLKQNQVAAAVGITQTYLSLIETGKKHPSTEVISKLADYYQTPLVVLMWLSTEESDINPERLEVFRMLKPKIDEFLSTLY